MHRINVIFPHDDLSTKAKIIYNLMGTINVASRKDVAVTAFAKTLHRK
jgi:hypothetical protein